MLRQLADLFANPLAPVYAFIVLQMLVNVGLVALAHLTLETLRRKE